MRAATRLSAAAALLIFAGGLAGQGRGGRGGGAPPAQLDTHIFDYIQKIYPRRFVVVDEERQLAFGFFMFNRPGDIDVSPVFRPNRSTI